MFSGDVEVREGGDSPGGDSVTVWSLIDIFGVCCCLGWAGLEVTLVLVDTTVTGGGGGGGWWWCGD